MARQSKLKTHPKHGDIGYIVRWNGHFENGDFQILHLDLDKQSALLKVQEFAFGFAVLKSINDIFVTNESPKDPITWFTTARFIDSQVEDADQETPTPHVFSFEYVEPLSRSQMKKLWPYPLKNPASRV